MNASRSGPPQALASALLLGSLLTLPAGAGTAPEEPSAPPERLVATLAASLGRPDLAAERSRSAAAAAEWSAGASPGAPSLGYQQEGIGPSFDDRPNAIRYLRWSQPVQAPWHLRAARAVTRGAATWQVAEGRARTLQALHEAGTLWLELALEVERQGILDGRLERLDRAIRASAASSSTGASSRCWPVASTSGTPRPSSTISATPRRRSRRWSARASSTPAW